MSLKIAPDCVFVATISTPQAEALAESAGFAMTTGVKTAGSASRTEESAVAIPVTALSAESTTCGSTDPPDATSFDARVDSAVAALRVWAQYHPPAPSA